MDMSSIMSSLAAATYTTTTFASPLLRSTAKLPPLAVAIGALTTSPQNAQTKKRKTTSHVARSILHTATNNNNRKSRVVFDFTEEEMAKYFHLPQRVAAKRLGVAVITIKRNCKRRGIKWPYRAKKLEEIQTAKSNKTALRRRSSSGNGCRHAPAAMSPMLLLSEAARAFSRLPVDCMVEPRPL